MTDPIFGMIPIASILPNPEQPRKQFDKTDLAGLAKSMKAHGVIEPISVEKAGAHYILHDGERRMRAAKLCGLELIPAMISPALNGTAAIQRLTRALVANVQSEQMHPVDDAMALKRLRDEFGLSNREISKQTGKAESWIGTRLVLADLDPEIQDLMRQRKMTSQPAIVAALNKITDRHERVSFAVKLAGRKATGKVIVASVNKYLNLRKVKGSDSTIALDLADQIGRKKRPEWDALFQLGRVPPWPAVNDAVINTCESCALRPIASPSVCGPCALPAFLKGLLEGIHTPREGVGIHANQTL